MKSNGFNGTSKCPLYFIQRTKHFEKTLKEKKKT